MWEHARWRSSWGLVVTVFMLVACSSGGDGDNGNAGGVDVTAINRAVACSPSGDDSTQNNDGSASFVRSHTVGSPLFHTVVTRKNSLNQDVSLNYMLHQPTGTPKGIVLLIAGGPLTAYLSGTEGNPATNSGGNFLVRSAHRFMQAGYRVITMDRPNDFPDYGSIDSAGYLYDAYRTSASHAVDIATIVNRENSDNLPVLIAGTSRGAISAVAQNALAMGVAISSPVTRSSAGGSPVGSPNLPVSVVQVPTHVLYHQDDGCGATQPANTAALITQLVNANVDVAGNHVTGGFNDTIDNNPCGAFSFHGFLGIENCAVNTTTDWADELLASLEIANPGNARPVAQSQTTATLENQAIDIVLTATDADDSNLSFQLPHLASALGGTLSINGSTVHYVPPTISTNTTDSFVFTVADSKGSRSAAVVNVNVSILVMFDHSTVVGQACASSGCHDGVSARTYKPDNHPLTTNTCELCHTTIAWSPFVVPFDHSQTTDVCMNCHNGTTASGKPANHPPTTFDCSVCHLTTGWLPASTPPP